MIEGGAEKNGGRGKGGREIGEKSLWESHAGNSEDPRLRN